MFNRCSPVGIVRSVRPRSHGWTDQVRLIVFQADPIRPSMVLYRVVDIKEIADIWSSPLKTDRCSPSICWIGSNDSRIETNRWSISIRQPIEDSGLCPSQRVGPGPAIRLFSGGSAERSPTDQADPWVDTSVKGALDEIRIQIQHCVATSTLHRQTPIWAFHAIYRCRVAWSDSIYVINAQVWSVTQISLDWDNHYWSNVLCKSSLFSKFFIRLFLIHHTVQIHLFSPIFFFISKVY